MPYNPETNPIEQMFNKLKTNVRLEYTGTITQLTDAIKYSLGMITSIDLGCYYKHSVG